MFSLGDKHFLRNGSPHLIVSGALHYCRVHPAHWADRLRRLRCMGANTVELYTPWNFHSPARGITDFEGPRDLGRFLDLAAEADLDIIVRPGPYICAEWDAGGLPSWLLTDPQVRLRTSEPTYLMAVDEWLEAVVPVIADRQFPDRGRVVMVQVENEYGSYGDDKAYLAHLRDGLVRRGITVPLVTSDGPTLTYLLAGTVDGALPTVNFGSRASEVIELMREEYPDNPAMCMEYWHGWFDHWGEQHHTRPPEEAAAEVATMLENNMSVNFYVAHGGTNFALWNGANYDEGVLQPTVTSYDYDAPIAESGALTAKFDAFREVIARHLPVPPMPDDLVPTPAVLPAQTLRRVSATVLGVDDLQTLAEATADVAPWLRLVTDPHPTPPTFEEVGLERGLLLLRAHAEHPGGAVGLRVFGLHDRAHVFVNGELVGVLERAEGGSATLEITADRGTVELALVVESLGRINFGPMLGERKGVLRGVRFGTHFVNGWRAWPIALDLVGRHLSDEARGSSDGDGLLLERFALPVSDEHAGRDAFLDMSEATRGYAFVGEDMLGRFWSRGPQQTLYVPGPLLHGGENIVTVVSTEPGGGNVRLSDVPILDRVSAEEPRS